MNCFGLSLRNEEESCRVSFIKVSEFLLGEDKATNGVLSLDGGEDSFLRSSCVYRGSTAVCQEMRCNLIWLFWSYFLAISAFYLMSNRYIQIEKFKMKLVCWKVCIMSLLAAAVVFCVNNTLIPFLNQFMLFVCLLACLNP